RVLTRLAHDGEHIHIAFPFRGHDLLRLNVLQRRELIADLRGALELQPPCRLLHPLLQSGVHLVAAAFEHLDGGLNVLRISLAADEPDAGRRAAADLMLQAGAAAIGEEAVAAVADAEELLQLIERVAHGPGRRERAEIPSGSAARAAIEG